MDVMKALSFRQPWAELVLQGRKTMDLRTYNTRYRGRLAIHASKSVERDDCLHYGLDPAELERGGLVGTVELVDVVLLDEATYDEHRDEHLAGRRYREGLYGWILARPERLPQMVPARGRTNLFNVEVELPEQAQPPAPPKPKPTERQSATSGVELNGTTPEKPFALHVQSLT